MNKRFLSIIVLIVVAFASCRYRNGHHDKHNMSSEQRSLTGFTGVETHGSIDLVVSQGNYNVKVEADRDVQQDVEAVIENGRLIVRFRDGISFTDFGSVTVYVSAPTLNAFETHGSGDIKGQGKISSKEKIDVIVAGSGDVSLSVDCPEVNTDTRGNGDIEISGETKNLTCKTSGSGDLKASDLKAENVKTSIHGSGDNEVFASVSLDVEISGSGDVHYRGDPKITTQVHGSGEVSKQN